MIFKSVTTGYIVSTFQEFYRELLIQRELAERSVKRTEETERLNQNSSDLVDELMGDTVNSEVGVCDKIQRRLRMILEEFTVDAQTQISDFTSSHFQEALYVMIALADEIFLSFDWQGKKYWEDNLLENQFFHTQIAGEAFFEKLDTLLHVNDPVRNEIAATYLMALALGFKGKFRGIDDEGQLARYRHRLYVMINRQPSDLFTPGREHLVPLCYDHTLTAPYGRGLPDYRTWIIVFSAIIIGYLFISSYLWHRVAHDLNQLLSAILKQASQLGLS